MKTLFYIVIFLSLSLVAKSQVSINISYLGDTIAEGPESVEDAMNSENAFQDDDLLVYPLQTSAVINIIRTSEIKKVYYAQVLDQNGTVIKKVVLDAINNQINMKKLSFGLYVLKIEPENTPVAEIEGSRQDSDGKGQ